MIVFIEHSCSDSPRQLAIAMVFFWTRWEIWRTCFWDFDCTQSSPCEKMYWWGWRSPSHSYRHYHWPRSSDVVVRCVFVQICVFVSMSQRGGRPLYRWWLPMSRQIYSRTWTPHVEPLEWHRNNNGHRAVPSRYLFSLSFVTERFRTKSDLLPTRMIGTCRLMIGWWSINSCSRMFLISCNAVWNDWRSVME